MNVELLADDARPERVRLHRSLIGAGVSLTVFLLLLIPNLELTRAEITPHADAAANQLLIDQAARGTLLVGHYSRTRFHHPGPFFLYEQAVGELVLQRWTGAVSSAFASHAVAVMALNAALAGWAAMIAFSWTRSTGVALLLPAMAMVVDGWAPGLLTSSWMPAVMVMPFLFLLVASASVAAGRWAHLPALAFAVGCCVHGHLSTAVVAVVVIAGVLVTLWWGRRRGEITGRPSRAELLWTAGVLGIFALPIVLHSTIDFPGELRRYVSYARGGNGQGANSLTDAVGFAARILVHGPWQAAAVVVAVTLAIVARRRTGSVGALFGAGLGLCALASVVFVGFAWRGVDDLDLTYLGWFAYGIPIVVVWLGAAAGLSMVAVRWPRIADVAAVVAAAAVVAGVLATTTAVEPYRGVPQIAAMADAVGTEPVAITFEPASWPTAVGLLAELQRRDVSACVDDPEWTFMVTEENVCTDGADRLAVGVVGPETTGDRPPEVLFDREGFAVWERSG